MKRKREEDGPQQTNGDVKIKVEQVDSNHQPLNNFQDEFPIDEVAWVDQLNIKELQLELKERNVSKKNFLSLSHFISVFFFGPDFDRRCYRKRRACEAIEGKTNQGQKRGSRNSTKN